MNDPITDEEWEPFANAIGVEPFHKVCAMCGEMDFYHDLSPTPVFTEDGPQPAHRSCMLREVIGGIGHLIAHDYWCTQMHDPDAGLTRRQSALLVQEYVRVLGVEKAASIHAADDGKG